MVKKNTLEGINNRLDDTEEHISDLEGSHMPQSSKARESEVAQSCPTLCDPMDCSPPSSSVHGILQLGILEWVARPSLKKRSKPY